MVLVQSLWVGNRLSRMEEKSIKSFFHIKEVEEEEEIKEEEVKEEEKKESK